MISSMVLLHHHHQVPTVVVLSMMTRPAVAAEWYLHLHVLRDRWFGIRHVSFSSLL